MCAGILQKSLVRVGFRRYKLQALAPSLEAQPWQGLICAMRKAGAVEKRVLPSAAAHGSGAAPENPSTPAALLGTVLPRQRGDPLPEEHLGFFGGTYAALWCCSWLISQDLQGGGCATGCLSPVGACPLPGGDTVLLAPVCVPTTSTGDLGPSYLQSPGHPCALSPSERRALGRGGRAV